MSAVRAARLVIAVLVATWALGVVGCQPKPEPKPEPEVSPPAIGQAGVFRAGVDLSVPPFGGVDAGTAAGLDLDVAAAVAEKLALTVEYVDVKPSEAATALADGIVDAVFSVSVAGADLSRVTPAGTYLLNGPGVFVAVEGTASVEPSLTLETLPIGKVAVQSESQSHWLLESELGGDSVDIYGTLREAIEALGSGKVGYAAGDAIIAAYIARDMPSIRLAGQLAPATPLAVVVAPENTTLSDGVRDALDELAADGVLSSVRRKWVGELPELQAEEPSEPDGAP
jgi:ABC-type amino acid transport substrate-binding protein